LDTVPGRADGRQAWILGVSGLNKSDIGQFADAVRAFEEAIELDKKQAWLFDGYAWALGSDQRSRSRRNARFP
jgi:hypothetical protein